MRLSQQEHERDHYGDKSKRKREFMLLPEGMKSAATAPTPRYARPADPPKGGAIADARRLTNSLLGLLVCALVFGVLGCGGTSSSNSDNAAYKAAVTSAATPWTTAATHFATAAQSTDVHRDLAAVDAFISANNAFANRLATIDAPSAAKSAHAGLIAALRTLSNGLTNLRHVVQADFQARKTTGLRAAEAAVASDLQGVRSTSQTLQAKVK